MRTSFLRGLIGVKRMAIGDNLASLVSFFTDLRPNDGTITSDETAANNCFAWAAGEKYCRWEPGHTWLSASGSDALENYVLNYKLAGFVDSNSEAYEPGFEKIAIYANLDGEATHAARLKGESGVWTSKLGDLEDIDHHSLHCLNGTGPYDYGTVAVFLKRPEGGPGKWKDNAIRARLNSSKTSKN